MCSIGPEHLSAVNISGVKGNEGLYGCCPQEPGWCLAQTRSLTNVHPTTCSGQVINLHRVSFHQQRTPVPDYDQQEEVPVDCHRATK